jgi:hypothetical protein
MPVDFGPLKAEVTRIEEVVPAIVTIINGIADKIAEAVAADDLSDNTETAGLADRVRAQADALAAAAVSGTPSEPPA